MHEMAGAPAVTPWSLATPPPQYQQDVPGPEALTTGDAKPDLHGPERYSIMNAQPLWKFDFLSAFLTI